MKIINSLHKLPNFYTRYTFAADELDPLLKQLAGASRMPQGLSKAKLESLCSRVKTLFEDDQAKRSKVEGKLGRAIMRLMP